jgi:SAM-dependent methyltransferase
VKKKSPSHNSPHDQAHFWSDAAQRYEQEFVDPYGAGVRNPLPDALATLAARGSQTVADLGCGIGPLLPMLSERFQQVVAVDFAAGMLSRARERVRAHSNIEFFQRSLTDLSTLPGPVDVAVAVNSLVLPDPAELQQCLASVHALVKPGGSFLGIVPGMDSVHYLTMLLIDRAQATGMPLEAARKNAAMHAEHELYDFNFGEFRYRGLVQHFWQPFEIPYRLRKAGFRKVRVSKVSLSWDQFRSIRDLSENAPPWDWFFQAERP